MRLPNPTVCMWRDALEQLDRADRMQRQCFQLGACGHGGLTWEPPVDVFETESQFIVVVALPGVQAEHLFVGLDGAVVSVHGRRPMPELCPSAHIHRVEIPYGRFERRIELPVGLPRGPLRLGARQLRDGCLLLMLDKTGGTP